MRLTHLVTLLCLFSASKAAADSDNPQPPVWSEKKLSFTLKTRDTFKADLGAEARERDGLRLRFSKKTGPTWLEVSDGGELQGTPADIDAGKTFVVVSVSNGIMSSEKAVRLEITKKNYPPTLVKPVEITVKEREVQRIGLKDFAADPDKEVLRFSSEPLPAWVSLNATGEIKFAPGFKEIGDHRFSFTAHDKEESVAIPATLSVIADPRAPEWTKDKVTFTATTRKPFQDTVAGRARDLDARPLKIAKVSGPEWITVSAEGALVGSPEDKDAGTSDLVLRAENADRGADKTVRIEVKMQNHPPTISSRDNLVFSFKERATARINLDDKSFVQDIDGDRLRFELSDKSDWLTLNTNGECVLRPLFKHIGKHTFGFKVKDGESEAVGSFSVDISREPRAPVWNSTTFGFTAKAREDFKESLSLRAKDLDGIPVTFSMKSGPAWLALQANGALEGTPSDADVGKHSLVLVVSNDLKSAETVASFEVISKNKPPVFSERAVDWGKVKAGLPFKKSVRDLASDPDPKDKLTFEKVSGPAWAVISPDGQVFGKPKGSEAGTKQIVIRVRDRDKESAELTANIEVAPESKRPTPTDNPIKLPTAYEGELFAYPLSKTFKDSTLTYKKLSGPNWLGLRPTGEFAGVPSGIGDFDFAVEVSNGAETLRFNGRGRVSAQ